jgi:hypothetical protein
MKEVTQGRVVERRLGDILQESSVSVRIFLVWGVYKRREAASRFCGSLIT